MVLSLPLPLPATNSNVYQLCFLESLYIKTVKPYLNTGIKATKELELFASRALLRFFALFISFFSKLCV